MTLTCESWLKEYLTSRGTAFCDLVREEAKKQGFGKAELKQARKALGVETFHEFDEDGATENWFWSLRP